VGFGEEEGVGFSEGWGVCVSVRGLVEYFDLGRVSNNL
jgi:hypothetical protein